MLVVDDSDDVRLLFQMILETDPRFTVWGQARHGAEALALVAKQHRPDVILLDLTMPVMDGMTALPILRERHPDVPVVVMTASPITRELQHDVLRLGATSVIPKSSAGAQDIVAALLRAVG